MIRPIKHQVGRSQLSDWSSRSTVLREEHLQDVTLPNADIHFVLFEAPMQQVLEFLPPSLHPCIPGIVAMTFVKCPESPWGAFEFAMVGIGCRSGIRPRFMIQSFYASNADAVEHLQQRCGYPAQLADVRTQINYDRILSTIVKDGRQLLVARTPDLTTLTGSGGSVVYSPSLCMADHADQRQLVQVDWSADFERVGRGEPKIEAFDSDALIGGDFAPTDPISATLARATLVLHKPVFILNPTVLPGEGGVSRLAVTA